METDRNGILQKYFSGKCTAEEKQFVEEFILNDENVQLENYLRSQWTANEKKESPNPEADLRYKRIKKRIDKSSAANWRSTWRVAASIIALFGITACLLFHFYGPLFQDHMIVSTEPGQQREVLLPDGTVVWLNCVSSIAYPKNFNGDFREVQIVGEAYFDVAENPELPFIVNFNEHYTKVLGTEFSIRSYPGEREDKITLVEGSVAVGEKQKAEFKEYTKMLPGEQVSIVNNLENHFSKRTIENKDIASSTSWKSGEIHFHKTPLKIVVKELQRWYGKDIFLEIQGPYAVDGQMTLTSVIKKGTTLEEVLQMLRFTHQLTYTTTDDKIVLTSKKLSME